MTRRITLAMLLRTTLAVTFLSACAADTQERVEPPSGSLTGYYQVHIALDTIDPAEVTQVRVGGIRAYDIAADGQRVVATVQGHPEAGLVDVEVESATDMEQFPDAFEYLPPVEPAFMRIASLGASLSQGVQNGVPTGYGALVSPAAQVAGQLGGYFPRPIFVDGLFPEMTFDDVSAPPACTAPSLTAHLTQASGGLADVIVQGFDTGRKNPDIEVHNVAVGASTLSDVLHGVSPDMIGGEFLPRLVYSPYQNIEQTQLEVVESLAPTLIISVDLYGNDAIAPLFTGSTIDVSAATPLEELEPDLEEMVGRLAATGAYVFLANLPRPSLLPLAAQKKRRVIARVVAAAREAGEDEEQAALLGAMEADQAIEAMDQNAATYNELLSGFADLYDNVHVVDTAPFVDDLADGGLMVGGEQLSAQKFGGILGIDSIHFTDTGYALLANLILDEINEVLGTSVPHVDVEQVLRTDRGSPSAIAELGFDVTLCAQ